MNFLIWTGIIFWCAISAFVGALALAFLWHAIDTASFLCRVIREYGINREFSRMQKIFYALKLFCDWLLDPPTRVGTVYWRGEKESEWEAVQ